MVGLVLAGDVRLRRRQCWTAGSTRMAQNAQKSRHVRHFLGRMSQYRAFGNGVDFLAEKRGKHQRQVFFLEADGEIQPFSLFLSVRGEISEGDQPRRDSGHVIHIFLLETHVIVHSRKTCE